MRARGWWATIAALLACALAGGCGRSERAPVESPDTPRIAAVSPAVAITLRDMGYEPWIVGRHGWDMALSPELPVVGDQAGLDYEALVSAQPTHVYVQWGARELPAQLTGLGAERGWVVRDAPLLTLEDVAAFARSAAAELGAPPVPGLTAADVESALMGPVPGRASGLRVLLVVAGEPLAALGPGSAHHQLLERVGGRSALPSGAGPYVRLHAEDVLTLSPDAIVVFDPGARGAGPAAAREAGAALGELFDVERARRLLGRVGELGVPAVTHGRLAVIDEPTALTPSTGLIGVGRSLRAALDRWVGTGEPANRARDGAADGVTDEAPDGAGG